MQMLKALSGSAESLSGSFLPEDYVARKSEIRANVLCLLLFGVVMFGVVAAFFVTNRQWLGVRKEQEQINRLYAREAAKIEQLNELEKQKKEMLNKAEITTALVEKIPRSLLLADLVTRLPEKITLTTVELESKRIKPASSNPRTPTGRRQPKVRNLTGGKVKSNQPEEDEPVVRPPKLEYTLTLVGLAMDNATIADYLTSLRSSTLLGTVELDFIKTTTKNETELREFQVIASLRENADARSIERPETVDMSGGQMDAVESSPLSKVTEDQEEN